MENKNKFVEFSKELKTLLEKRTNLKFIRRVFKMVGNNPFIEVGLRDWEENKIPNDLRVSIAKTLNFNVIDWDNVTYGNIREGYITLNYSDWLKVVKEVLNNESE